MRKSQTRSSFKNGFFKLTYQGERILSKSKADCMFVAEISSKVNFDIVLNNITYFKYN